MNETDRAALVDELTQAQHDAWPGVDADFIVNTEAIMPIIERLLAAAASPGLEMVRLQAQVRYLKSSLISAEMRAENVKGRGPEVVARIERIIGGIDGNMEVAAVEAERNAVAQTTATQEGASDE